MKWISQEFYIAVAATMQNCGINLFKLERLSNYTEDKS